MVPALVCLFLATPPMQQRATPTAVLDMQPVRQDIALLAGLVRGVEARLGERVEALSQHMKTQGEEIGALARRGGSSVAAPFLAAPPPSSDFAGVAKVAVFAPRVEVDSARRHDNVTLKLRRLEAGGSQGASEITLGSDETATALPIGASGALYVVDWSTSEGQSYTLHLRDGATGQIAATVQVKPLQNEGKFIFVGYRLD